MEPQTRLGVATLTHMAYRGDNLDPIRSELVQKILENGRDAGALMDLSVIDQLYGAADMGLWWQQKAFETSRLYQTETQGDGKTRLLVIAQPSSVGGNTPVEFLLRNTRFEITTYYLDPASPQSLLDDAAHLGDHDIIFCAIPADGAQAPALLKKVRDLGEALALPVVNAPAELADIDRIGLSEVLADLPGVRVPSTHPMDRRELETLAQADVASIKAPKALKDVLASACSDSEGSSGATCLIRPVGSHAGLGLTRLTGRKALQTYLTERYETEFYVSTFINYATPEDGLYRKYRIVFVDSQAFPCHMAIAPQWDVWYLNANMEGSEAKRAEEASFMEHFAEGFGLRHGARLEQIAARIGLDYFGIDCAEDADGNLVVFEADNALIVHDMDCDTLFPYKRGPMRRLFRAFEALLVQRCSASKDTHAAELGPGKATTTAAKASRDRVPT